MKDAMDLLLSGRNLLLLFVLLLSGLFGRSSNSLTASEPKYDVAIAQDVWVSMRDGIRLATDIYLPANKGVALAEKFPTILQRTPYDKHGKTDIAIGNYFASHGYAVVIQDTR